MTQYLYSVVVATFKSASPKPLVHLIDYIETWRPSSPSIPIPHAFLRRGQYRDLRLPYLLHPVVEVWPSGRVPARPCKVRITTRCRIMEYQSWNRNPKRALRSISCIFFHALGECTLPCPQGMSLGARIIPERVCPPRAQRLLPAMRQA